MTTLLTTDADFLAAERQLVELRAEREALSPSVKTLDDEKRLINPLSDRIWTLYDQITLSPPVSLVSALVKLRLLSDPDIGLAAGEGENDVASVQQVLGLVERVAGGDDAILTLFRQWREAVSVANNQEPETDEEGQPAHDRVYALEHQIYDTPAMGAAGLAVKAYMLACDGQTDEFKPDYGPGGLLTLDKHATKSVIEDAVRIAPELAPLVGNILSTPTQRPEISRQEKLATSGPGGDAAPTTAKAQRSDPLAAAISEALALRLLSRYRDARGAVEDYGGEMSALPDAPSFAEIEERYTKLVRQEVLGMKPETASAELRFLDLVEAIIADRLSPHEAPVASDEEDLSCALQLVQWVRNRANSRDLAEGLAEWREAQQ
jgi:hypothetical protein